MAVDNNTLTTALEYHQAGQFALAREIYQQLLAADPGNADLLSLLGAACINLREYEAAAEHLIEALRANPDHQAAHDNLGVLLAKQERFAEAAESFRRAAELNPQHAASQLNLANALVRSGQTDAAIEAYRRALALSPGSVKAHAELAQALLQQNRAGEALGHLGEVARLKPADPKAQFEYASALAACGQAEQAEAYYRETLRLKPDSAESCVNLANLLVGRKKYEEGVSLLRRAIEMRPRFTEAYLNLGSALTKQEKFAEATEVLEEAIRLRPEMSAAYNNLGIAQAEEGHFIAAEASYRRALELEPDDADAYYNLGIALLKQKMIASALEYFEHAIVLKPDYAEAHHNRSAALLLSENYGEGFAEYEWRMRSRDFSPPKFRWPVWDGSDLSGRAIVLCAEQGLGDTLQFVRYAPLLKEKGAAKVIVQCTEALHPLLGRTPGVDQWITGSTTQAEADCCAPLLSLPHLLGTTHANLPATVPYVFADPQLAETWRERLAEYEGFKVGIVWQGNPMCPGDRFRSISLSHYAPLAELPGVQLINLQKGPGHEQLAAVAEQWRVVDFGQSLDTASGAFMDTAAIMKNLDLVITSDTAAAHLAGALGVRTWLALQYVPDWRWLLERHDSPWYPSMRLFRQAQWGQWPPVFAEMAKLLAMIVAERSIPTEKAQ